MATAPGKAPTPTTVTLKHLAAALAETHEMSKKQAEAVLGDFVGNIVKHLKKGERIRIGGLGILQVRKRAARMGRNPATGEAIQIKASKKVAFRLRRNSKRRSDLTQTGPSGIRRQALGAYALACRFILSVASPGNQAIDQPALRAISSVGRAPPLHGGCRRFESVIAYHFPDPQKKTAPLRGAVSVWS